MEIVGKYIHKVDKSQIPTCNIMGVNIAAINMEWLLDFTDKHIKELSGEMIFKCFWIIDKLQLKNMRKKYCGNIMAC